MGGPLATIGLSSPHTTTQYATDVVGLASPSSSRRRRRTSSGPSSTRPSAPSVAGPISTAPTTFGACPSRRRQSARSAIARRSLRSRGPTSAPRPSAGSSAYSWACSATKIACIWRSPRPPAARRPRRAPSCFGSTAAPSSLALPPSTAFTTRRTSRGRSGWSSSHPTTGRRVTPVAPAPARATPPQLVTLDQRLAPAGRATTRAPLAATPARSRSSASRRARSACAGTSPRPARGLFHRAILAGHRDFPAFFQPMGDAHAQPLSAPAGAATRRERRSTAGCRARAAAWRARRRRHAPTLDPPATLRAAARAALPPPPPPPRRPRRRRSLRSPPPRHRRAPPPPRHVAVIARQLAPLPPSCHGGRWYGTADGLPENPMRALEGGRATYVPTVVGNNNDEGSLFVPLLPLLVGGTSFPPKAGDLNRTLRQIFGPGWANSTAPRAAAIADAVAERYNVADYGGSEFWRDAPRCATLFACPARRRHRRPLRRRRGACLPLPLRLCCAGRPRRRDVGRHAAPPLLPHHRALLGVGHSWPDVPLARNWPPHAPGRGDGAGLLGRFAHTGTPTAAVLRRRGREQRAEAARRPRARMAALPRPLRPRLLRRDAGRGGGGGAGAHAARDDGARGGLPTGRVHFWDRVCGRATASAPPDRKGGVWCIQHNVYLWETRPSGPAGIARRGGARLPSTAMVSALRR